MRAYTRIAFKRAGVISQMFEVDLSTRSNPARYLRLWFARMADIELDQNYTVHVSVGTEITPELEASWQSN